MTLVNIRDNNEFSDCHLPEYQNLLGQMHNVFVVENLGKGQPMLTELIMFEILDVLWMYCLLPRNGC